VNGKTITDIQDLADALSETPEGGIHTIEFNDFPKIIYVDDTSSRFVNEQLIQYGINKLERLE